VQKQMQTEQKNANDVEVELASFFTDEFVEKDYEGFNDPIPDDRLRENDRSKLLENKGKIAIVLSLGGGFSVTQKICDALDEIRDVKIAPDQYIWRTNKDLIELLSDEEVKRSRQFDFLRIVWIGKEYFEGPGFWKVDEDEDGVESLLIEKEAYKLWSTENEKFLRIKNICNLSPSSRKMMKKKLMMTRELKKLMMTRKL
jgi:hypothetical protein